MVSPPPTSTLFPYTTLFRSVNVVREGVADDPRHADDGELDVANDRLRGSMVRVEIRQLHTDDDIADVLLDVVDSEQAELLVLGLRRQTDLARHLMGLTVQKLLLSARRQGQSGRAPGSGAGQA